MPRDIRAFTVSEILDESFQLLKDHFVPLVSLGLIAQLPIRFAYRGLELAPGEAATATFWISFGVVMVLTYTLSPLCNLAVIWAVAEAQLGHEIAVGPSLKAALACFVKYLGTLLLMSLLLLLASLVILLPAIYLLVCWTLVGAVVAIEGVSGRRCLGRSRELVRGHWWRTLGILMLAMLLPALIASGGGFMFGAIPLLGPLVEAFLGSIAFAFSSAVVVLLYFDLRCRLEDFDLQLLAREVGATEELGTPAPQPGGA